MKAALQVLETVRKHRFSTLQVGNKNIHNNKHKNDPKVQPLFTIEWESIDNAQGVFEFWSVVCEERRKMNSPKPKLQSKIGTLNKLFSRDRSKTVV